MLNTQSNNRPITPTNGKDRLIISARRFTRMILAVQHYVARLC
jgi:hypothetical protein